MLATLAVRHGYGAWGLVVGPLVAVPLLSIAASFQTVVDTGLKLRVPAPKLRNLQALVNVLTSVTLAPGISGRPFNGFGWWAFS
jgi:hypothetical protein